MYIHIYIGITCIHTYIQTYIHTYVERERCVCESSVGAPSLLLFNNSTIGSSYSYPNPPPPPPPLGESGWKRGSSSLPLSSRECSR